jgi:hypothetical protein
VLKDKLYKVTCRNEQVQPLGLTGKCFEMPRFRIRRNQEIRFKDLMSGILYPYSREVPCKKKGKEEGNKQITEEIKKELITIILGQKLSRTSADVIAGAVFQKE